MGKAGCPMAQPLVGAAGAPEAGGWGNLVSPMFTSGPIREAHNAAMNMGRLSEGHPLPGPPPLGEGTGLLPTGRGWGNPVAPCPNRGWGRLAPPQAGGWGKAVAPYVHIRPHSRSAQRRDEHGASFGGPPPPWPPPLGEGTGLLPTGRGWGNPVSPFRNRRWGRLAPPQAGGWGKAVSPCPNRGWERQAPPQAGGVGKPGFPTPQPPLGAPGTPTGRGMGKPGFPVFSPQGTPASASTF